MVVDDAVVVRGLLSRWIEEEPGLALAASVRTGRDAVAQLGRTDPDVVILDVQMPELDGISALPLLLENKPDLVVIMASSLTRRHAEISLKALSLGAADYISKPETHGGMTASAAFRRELMEKILQLGGRRKRRIRETPETATFPSPSHARPAFQSDEATRISAAFKLRPFSSVPPRILLIGASTGGPPALTRLGPRLGTLAGRVPVLVTQHMPATFTTILAEHLARASGGPAREPRDGEPAHPGTIYLAPGGRHMRLARGEEGAVIALDDGPPVNFCKPAVDPLFSSAAEIWGAATLAVVLTGMGSDGTMGARSIVAAGGSVIAQDVTTSVVWGMPGSVAQAGLCSAVLPIDHIGPRLVELFGGDRL